MVGHHEQAFLTQAQTLGFHCRSCHLKTFAGTHLVGEQGVPTIKHMSNCIALMFLQIDLRVHTDKMDMASVILAGPGTIEQLVILLHQQIPPLRVLPNPACKGILDGLLLLLGKHRLLLVQDTPLFTILLNGIINAAVPQIQGVLQNLVGVGPMGAVGFGGHDIIHSGGRFVADAPFGRKWRVADLDQVVIADAVGRLKSLHHKLLHNGGIQPCGTQSDVDF